MAEVSKYATANVDKYTVQVIQMEMYDYIQTVLAVIAGNALYSIAIDILTYGV